MTPSPLFLVNILPAHLYVSHNQLGASQVAQKVENLPAMWGDPGLIPGLGRSPGEGSGYLLQYSCLDNPMDTGAW